MINGLLFFGFFFLVVATIPIAYALGLASVLWVWLNDTIPMIMLPQRMYAGIDSFPLIAIPFFILAGKIMAVGGISDRLIKVALVLVGRFRGGLAYVNVVASMFFAGISGSATADASSIGAILIPAMLKKGYEKDFTVAITATAAVIGILIPPSIPMVLYGIIMNQSIGDLFLAGAIPGVLVGFTLMGIAWFIARKRNYPREAGYSWKESIKIFLDGILPISTVLVVLGGIITGFVTPTEAAVIAVAYAFILSFFVYREFKLRDLPTLLLETVRINGMVMLMVATATVFSWIVTSQEIPKLIGEFLVATIHSKVLMLLIFNVILLFVGHDPGPHPGHDHLHSRDGSDRHAARRGSDPLRRDRRREPRDRPVHPARGSLSFRVLLHSGAQHARSHQRLHSLLPGDGGGIDGRDLYPSPFALASLGLQVTSIDRRSVRAADLLAQGASDIVGLLDKDII